jgi:two-component system sensor histidine kinase AlgZ
MRLRSIGQNRPRSLPDFRNLGVVLRVLLAVNVIAVLVALARNKEWVRLPGDLAELAALVEAPLIAALALFYLSAPVLARLPAWLARVSVIAMAAILRGTVVAARGAGAGLEAAESGWTRPALAGALAAVVVLFYFDLRNRAISPALADARLMALTARIRPHFLFNSLNAVLGVIRSDPQRAEAALEELSDLFRVLMAENRELTTLAGEIELCRRYLDLERLRLGDRLAVHWEIDECPRDALVPPLMLQPLLENAVYHGIEPAPGPAQVAIAIARRGDRVHIDIANPFFHTGRHHAGSRMALDNIRERLMLFFDLEASLDTAAENGEYRVKIRLPYRTAVSGSSS